ncbi:methyl-accepting chemotaxis protein [Halanaerobium salsuginis]|uniref:Methyl-accepting chemotaxis protein n=1 Tax=Halanaerobium salsuginis TaxID=29563 RepID=A0A1I4MLY4_9FIRM|nr:methyl-accepting chemotaxis protein [Halanaerobium salsuginis]SFM04067.1 methyl-accepting chemotaxis protein [Halanaerobium salsuginis]
MLKKIRRSMFAKFTLSFLLLIILFATASYFEYYYSHQVFLIEEEVGQMQEFQLKLSNLEIDHHLWMISLYDMFTGGDVPQLGDFTECNLGQWYYNTEPPVYLKGVFQELEKPHQSLHNDGQQVVRLYQAGQQQEALNVFNQNIKSDLAKVRTSLNKMTALTEDQISKLTVEKENLVALSDKIFLYATILTLLSALFISYFLTRITVKPLVNLVQQVENVAAGDLTKKVKVNKTDEIGQLVISFNNMIDTLRQLVSSINDNSDAVVTAVKDLNTVAQDTGRGSEDIAHSITDVASGSEDIADEIASVKSVAAQLDEEGETLQNNVNESLELSSHSSKIAESGQQAIEKAISQLDVVSETVNFATGAIEKLGKRSEEIGEMVAMIEGISAQTNLLALNAAIEAARAGEKGRGFSVVAEEVRELAEESAEVTSKISSLIEDIQSETTATVNSMDTNIVEVNKQIEIINSAGDSLKEMVSSSQITNQKMIQMNQFAADLDKIIDTINKAVDSVGVAIENNSASAEEVSALAEEQSATVEEISASADELENMAKNLHDLVSRFKTK